MTPRIAGLKSIKQFMEPGIYAYCRCGYSSSQPFCDGSHEGTGMEPLMVEITHQVKISWCACKHTSKGYLCDNTHRTLAENISPKL